MLQAYEQGRMPVDTPQDVLPSQAGRQDVILGHILTAIPAPTVALKASLGTAVMVKVDWTTTPPTISDITNTDHVYTVMNATTSEFPPGYYLLAREPTSGYYLPAAVPPEPMFAVITSLTSTPIGGATAWPCFSYSAPCPRAVGADPANAWIVNPWDNLPLPMGSPIRVYPIAGANPGGLPVVICSYHAPYYTDTTPASFTDHPSESYGVLAGVGSSLVLGNGYFIVGGGSSFGDPFNGIAYLQTTDLYVGDWKGATGTDGIGNQFVSGLNVNIGRTINGPGVIDGGSDW